MNKKDVSTRNRIIVILLMLLCSAALIVVAMLLRGKGEKAGSLENGAADPDSDRTDGTYSDAGGTYGFAMGSTISVRLYGEDAEACQREAIDAVKELDRKVISWREEGSELAEWNRTAKAGTDVKLSRTLGDALDRSLELSDTSDGALDITLRPVLEVWGIEEATPDDFRVPSEQELKAAGAKTGTADLRLTGSRMAQDGEGSKKNEEAEYALARSREDIILDLGSVGKGYALDVVYDNLQGRSLSGGVIAVGGSIMVYGSRGDGREFRVGIRDPEGLPEDILGYITFASGTGKQCISTSGGYEKYIEKDGVRYHHIIDPKTLRPAESDLISVTVICGNGLLSDGLSTACFILGEERAVKLLRKYEAEGVFVRRDGSVISTPGIEKQVVLQ